MNQPLTGHYFISSYEPNMNEAKTQFLWDVTDETLDRGIWQLWRIKETKYGMHFVITFTVKNKKFRESDKVEYIELLREVDTSISKAEGQP